jgi:UDP-N-acetylglucosamine--N-acetylmuramyl-(pentapeptide) pyrophosphoryl-undecaprenol N-acetylglucosamine transferase
MKILFTCGGTAGHINPAVALARLFQERKPECQILFVGAKGGMEERLIPKEGFCLETVTISAFRRNICFSSFCYNFKTLRNLRQSRREAQQILKTFQPDLVVGTGGYASYPVVREAAKQNIPTAVHESNAVPGLTTRRLAQYVDKVLLGFPESSKYYRCAKSVVVTGTPVRGEFFHLSKREAKEKLGISPDKPLVLSYWGSLGAAQMNRYMLDYMELLAKDAEAFYQIHSAGRNYADMLDELSRRKIILPKSIRIEDYIYDMPCVMAAADLVLCRGGASTISELTAIGKAAIIVPSPNVTNNHQEKNANVLAKKGAAVMILESECSGERLHKEASLLLTKNAKRVNMERAMAASGIPDAADRIYQTLVKLLQKG